MWNGNVWVAGESDNSSAAVWEFGPTLNSIGGPYVAPAISGFTQAFFGATAYNGALYAVGDTDDGTGTDGNTHGQLLITKFSEDGTVVWSHTLGDVGTNNALYDIVGVNGELYAVGAVDQDGTGVEDAVVLEIDPATGLSISQKTYGGAEDDFASAIATDGENLFVAGATRSFTADGQPASDYNAFLSTYSLGAPVITGDLEIVVNLGGSVVLTPGDFHAVDPDNSPDQLTFTVTNPKNGHLVLSSDQLSPITSFTEAQLEAGAVLFVSDNLQAAFGSFTVSVSDGVMSSAPTIINATFPSLTVRVLTAAGFNFQTEDPFSEMGSGAVQPGGTSTFTIENATTGHDFIFTGTGFTYDPVHGNAITGGTINHIQEVDHTTSAEIVDITGNLPADKLYAPVVAKAGGDHSQVEALTSNLNINFVGGVGPDAFGAGDGNDFFVGSGGGDFFDGGPGFDRVTYWANVFHAAGPIDVELAAGTVTGASPVPDTLSSIEFVTGTDFADTFNALGFGPASQNAGNFAPNNVNGTFNEFEGLGGDDTITGNGTTQISYFHATAGVTVEFTSWANSGPGTSGGASGTATGDASVGTDTFTGVDHVRGSNFADTFIGVDRPAQNIGEYFEGRGGNDLITGGMGFDEAVYSNEDAGNHRQSRGWYRDRRAGYRNRHIAVD